MTPSAPLLRSPPFPWVASEVAAISAPGATRLESPERLFAAMGAARVGGAFWTHDDPWRPRIVRLADAGDETALIAAIDGRRVEDHAGCTIDAAMLRTRAVAAIEAASYRDPFTGGAIDALAAVAILAEWRRMIDANRPLAAAVGMAAWKRPAMAQFLWTGTATPRFSSAPAALARAGAGAAVAYWPSRTPAGYAASATAAGVAAWQIEDGFLRSAGLGVECRPPMSVLIDRSGGIHFDPAHVSEIEMILAGHDFGDELLARARGLRARVVAARLGKYGADRDTALPPLPAGRRIVLAIGQVANDLSVIHGGGDRGMSGFLDRVRAAEPDAFIVYRPHPDVVTGLRRGDLTGHGAADLVAAGGSLLALIERVDAVHVLSSLTGFEALLRGVPVTVHGVPFYSGWGLTTDLAAQPARRGRTLSLDALVAGALILAPRYRDPVTELPCPAEVLVERLAASAAPSASVLTGLRKALGATRRTLALAERRA